MSTYVEALHLSGVHTECERKRCRLAGTVERLHSHDHDGPLACGCEELAC